MLLQVLARGVPHLVDPEVVGHAVDLLHQPLAILVVITLMGDGGRLVAVQPIQRLEVRSDRRNVAGGDGLGPELHGGSEAIQLQLGMIGVAVDRTLLQLLGHDLADARAAQAFLSRDFVIGEALAQPVEDPSPPEDHAVNAQPPALSRRLVFNHPTLS